MLGWMLKRGGSAPDPLAEGAGDTTIIDQPDTPAPVFATRAIKSALFGAAPRPASQRVNKSSTTSGEEASTPKSKPSGILLTPGTGTSRPKRVSFGREVKQSKLKEHLASKDGDKPKRTRLNEALDNARRAKISGVNKKVQVVKKNHASDDDWVEEDEEENGDGEDYCTHDITVDLNEPHSQSGKYWKEEFQKYQQDAKVELDRMLQYKQLAKSYAKEKDAEAMKLAELLREEQQKVVNMEKKITQNASEIISKRHHDLGDASPELIEKLAKQTTMAVQYRQRVEELEDQMEELLEDKEEQAGANSRRRTAATSPRTQKTLIETQRELRRARAEVRENSALREQVASLQKRLQAAERRDKNSELIDSNMAGSEAVSSQLRELRNDLEEKNLELEQLRKDFRLFQEESQTHEKDSNAVLLSTHTKVAELKKEIKTLKSTAQLPIARPASWHVGTPLDEEDMIVEDMEARPEKKVQRRDTTTNRISATRSRLEARRMARRSASHPNITIGDNTDVLESDEKAISLRDKFRGEELIDNTTTEVGPPFASGALRERPNLEKPKWQPFVPRSPRNRAYLGEDIAQRIENGGITPAYKKSRKMATSDLQSLAKSIGRSEKLSPEGDLLEDRFTRLGGPDGTGSKLAAKTSTSKLAPERRAAALARIEHRMAEKKRTRSVYDKENVRP